MNHCLRRISLLILFLATSGIGISQETTIKAGNPVFPGWYADPEGIIFGNEYWIYPTFSDHSDASPDISRSLKLSEKQQEAQAHTINPQYVIQTFFDAFSSPDLIHWTKHSNVLNIENISWASYALWAPSVIKANDQYYFFFGANDIQSNEEYGGIGVAVSKTPEGPFKDALGKPLINEFHNNAQPIDQFVFKDDDGAYYMIYGGWKHCNVVRLADDLLSVKPFEDGAMYKEITPEGYVEGPFMFKKDGKYYFMWSEGGWGGPNYSVAYAIADNPLGPFKRIGKILQQDPEIATGAGHHSVIKSPTTNDWYIIYHRRPLGDTNGNHREVCIDKMYFDENGYILPVKITFEGVGMKKLE